MLLLASVNHVIKDLLKRTINIFVHLILFFPSHFGRYSSYAQKCICVIRIGGKTKVSIMATFDIMYDLIWIHVFYSFISYDLMCRGTHNVIDAIFFVQITKTKSTWIHFYYLQHQTNTLDRVNFKQIINLLFFPVIQWLVYILFITFTEILYAQCECSICRKILFLEHTHTHTLFAKFTIEMWMLLLSFVEVDFTANE